MLKRSKIFVSLFLTLSLLLSFILPMHAIDTSDPAPAEQPQQIAEQDATTSTAEDTEDSNALNRRFLNTYSCLSPEERDRMYAINNAAVARRTDQPMLGVRGVIPPEDIGPNPLYEVSPTDPVEYLYSGVVLIVVLGTVDDDPTKFYFAHGTGFMVIDDTIVTAAHILQRREGITITEKRVYYDVDFECYNQNSLELSDLNGYPYRTISDWEGGINSTTIYGNLSFYQDWAVCKLDGSIPGGYYFNCYPYDSSMIGNTCYLVGYPKGFLCKMMESYGKLITYRTDQGSLVINATVIEGMSGGPAYAYVGRRSAIGIIKGYFDPTAPPSYVGYGAVVPFSNAMINTICDMMIE